MILVVPSVDMVGNSVFTPLSISLAHLEAHATDMPHSMSQFALSSVWACSSVLRLLCEGFCHGLGQKRLPLDRHCCVL